ncbi:hypothetical protein FE394_16820 [Xenorhabdus sp. Reich]|uniref:Uncharacterized protein n=1 Tax=Xenorhabdus littoralis TaxID=2582835 RepID=A0ABU4SQG5_9GAMM|nr:hypothetical protein [Xenorhabdus sp. Reich]MDX8000804.1 hypothetical protein [Xenorhabdus sp. Reich]
MTLETIIKGDNSSHLVLRDFYFKGEDFYACIDIKSSWYHAKVNFDSSYDRIKEFLISLDELISKKVLESNFINENGNVDINISVNHLGKVKVSGCLLNDMLESSSLTYEIESDLQNLVEFYSKLRAILII